MLIVRYIDTQMTKLHNSQLIWCCRYGPKAYQPELKTKKYDFLSLSFILYIVANNATLIKGCYKYILKALCNLTLYYNYGYVHTLAIAEVIGYDSWYKNVVRSSELLCIMPRSCAA